jgi:hypothetical protein
MVRAELAGRRPPCSMYSLVIDGVHANPVVKCVLHAVYILSKRGPRSTFAPCYDVRGHMLLINT